MCAILDNDVCAEVFGQRRTPAGQGFFDWLNSRGRLVIGGRNRRELLGNSQFRKWQREASLAGKVMSADDDQVDELQDELERNRACRSNDAHVIALAQIGGARLLYSNDGPLAACAIERHVVPIKAQDARWAWAGVKCGVPEGPADFMALAQDFKNLELISGPPGKVFSTRRTDGFTRARRALLRPDLCRRGN